MSSTTGEQATRSTPALVRTIVPIAVGVVLSWLATYNVEVSGGTEVLMVQGLTGLLTAIYYTAAYALQSRWPIAGLLLGSTARPSYSSRRSQASSDPATATPDAPENGQ